jgi:uncharacterized protein YvpB
VSGFEVAVVKKYLSLVLLTFVVAVGSIVTSLVLPKDSPFSPSSAIAQQAEIRNGFASLTLPSTANQDNTWSCGANSAARVLRYYGHGVSYNNVRDVAQFEHGIIPTRLCVGSGILKTCVNTGEFKTGLEPNEVRSVLSNWEGGNAKYESGADLSKIKRLLSQGKPVIVLRRVGSIQPGLVFGTWPAMHWVAVHGYNDQERKIYFTETEPIGGEECNGGINCSSSYDKFMSEWDWRIGDGLASETFHRKGVKPRTIVWVDRTPPSLASASTLGFYKQQDRPEVYLVYRPGFYCRVQNEDQMNGFGGFGRVQVVNRLSLSGTNTGDCGWSNGFFKRSNQPEVYRMYGSGIPEFNIGDSFCHVQNETQMTAYGGFGQVRVVAPNSDLGRGRTFTGGCPNP